MQKNNAHSAIRSLYSALLDRYGEQHWWPCRSGTRWEIIAGAVLTQNTAWTNVEKAIDNLLAENLMSPQKILSVPDPELQELIRPAGFFKQKTAYLKHLAQFILQKEMELLHYDDLWKLRNDLLACKGVGRETADSILLYAFQKPVFVIDAYTRRISERHLQLDGTMPYDQLQNIFMDSLEPDPALYGEYHALIVALCKDSCKKNGCGNSCRRLFSF